ncbi:tetratricopeptide repeat protein [Siphonobacter sp. SORGH_AS_0500]|uniref:tetratricopeptide repeat protein n=1 Tax=Siphonobacter sp. SORGH_AS_0500 TaxID=1864824 RepID=UPI002858019E|nr:hypothetical protein [Siphonobacter sp. SORGH_AS_0500]MDR6194332.1 tetratricopeptide (TPR) repeat protein [Siphonobacter sp. SORGH_AS_0500]
MKRLLFFTLFFASFHGYSSDFEWNTKTQQAYLDIFKLKLTKGQQELSSELGTNGVALYLDDYADMLYLLLTEDRRSYEALVKKGEQRLERLEDMDQESPWNRCLRAEIKMHWAFVKIKFGKEVPGAWDVIKAYKLLDENAKKFPQFTYNKKALGMLHVLIGSTPESYRWVTKLLGLRGNIQQGLQEIHSVAVKEPLFKPEAQLIEYLMQAYVLRLSKSEVTDFQKFLNQNDDNLLIQFFGNSILMKEGYGEAALAIANNHPASREYLSIPFFTYHKGEILLQKGDYDQAILAYQQFLKQHNSGNFIKDAYYKQYLCYELDSNSKQAQAYFSKIKSVGETNNEADKTAQKASDKPYVTFTANQRAVMKARFASDGGYYEQALGMLKNLTEASFTDLYDQTEFNYRKARIYHRMNDFVAALPLYLRAVELGEKQNWHFAPSSCLQIGYIYQLRNEKAKAKSYFEKAMSFKKHESKNSVDGKAKAALNEMGY